MVVDIFTSPFCTDMVVFLCAKEEVIKVNVVGCLNLADICSSRGIHMTYYGTGCIYEYNEAHPMNSGIGFTEDDSPNFTGSFYSKTKVTISHYCTDKTSSEQYGVLPAVYIWVLAAFESLS